MINLSPNCENNLGFDDVSSPNSCLPKFQTGIGPSQYKIKQSSHNYEINQIIYKLGLKNNSVHNSVRLNPLSRSLASHSHRII